MSNVLIAIAVLTHFFVLVVLLWGWIRWARRPHQWNWSSIFSFAGFTIATASALLGIGSIVYAQVTGGFGFYDPLLLRIYRWGMLLSITALGFASGGLWRRNLLRWHAPLLSLGVLILWVIWASGE